MVGFISISSFFLCNSNYHFWHFKKRFLFSVISDFEQELIFERDPEPEFQWVPEVKHIPEHESEDEEIPIEHRSVHEIELESNVESKSESEEELQLEATEPYELLPEDELLHDEAVPATMKLESTQGLEPPLQVLSNVDELQYKPEISVIFEHKSISPAGPVPESSKVAKVAKKPETKHGASAKFVS